MAAITALNWEAALGISGAGTPYGGNDDRPIFEAGDQVIRYSDLPTTGSNRDVKRVLYTVVSVELRLSTSGGVTKLLDQSQAFATSAVSDGGTTTRTYTGFDHQGTPATTVNTTTWSSPFFYVLQDSTGQLVRIHQADITTKTAAETYIGANIASWWT